MRTRRRMKSRRTAPPLQAALILGGLVLTTLVGCGGEARSESEVPMIQEAVQVEAPDQDRPELLERADGDTRPATEGRWQPAAYIAAHRESDPAPSTGSETSSVPGTDAETTAGQEGPGPVERETPPLVATDQGEGQLIEPEPSSDLGSASEDPESDVDLDLSAEGSDGVDESTDDEASADADPFDDATLDEGSGPEPLLVLAGTEMTFTVESDVSTEDHRAGDVFYAYLTDDVVAADGLVLLPRGSRARGRVVEALAREDSEELPVLDVVLEELMGPEGNSRIEAVVIEADFEGEARDSDGESVVKVLTGAAAGAILGRILGDDDDAVKGGLAGAAAGAAVAYGTRGGHAKLAAGAQITVRLAQPMAVY